MRASARVLLTVPLFTNQQLCFGAGGDHVQETTEAAWFGPYSAEELFTSLPISGEEHARRSASRPASYMFQKGPPPALVHHRAAQIPKWEHDAGHGIAGVAETRCRQLPTRQQTSFTFSCSNPPYLCCCSVYRGVAGSAWHGDSEFRTIVRSKRLLSFPHWM